MAKPTTRDAVWTTIDPTTLPAAIQQDYAAYKALYVEMKEARNEFETNLAKAIDLAPGKRVIFGYNFGKLSIAIVDDDRKPASRATNHTLASFLADLQSRGERT